MKFASIVFSLLALIGSMTTQAQTQNHPMLHQQMQSPHQMQMQQRHHQMGFPTAAQMHGMSPMTEEKLNQRFALQKENLQKIIDQDKKDAAKYAENFAQHQKTQAEQLQKMLASADEQRAKMMQNLEQHHQMALKHFQKMQTENNQKRPPE